MSLHGTLSFDELKCADVRRIVLYHPRALLHSILPLFSRTYTTLFTVCVCRDEMSPVIFALQGLTFNKRTGACVAILLHQSCVARYVECPAGRCQRSPSCQQANWSRGEHRGAGARDAGEHAVRTTHSPRWPAGQSGSCTQVRSAKRPESNATTSTACSGCASPSSRELRRVVAAVRAGDYFLRKIHLYHSAQ